jgi:hypothetical protein
VYVCLRVLPSYFTPRSKNVEQQKKAEVKTKQAEQRKHLANIRVVQRNLVYVVGIPTAYDEVRQGEWQRERE